MSRTAGGRPRSTWCSILLGTLLRFSSCILLPFGVALLHAQQPSPADRARMQREELERTRAERERLEARMRELRGTAHDIGEERTNLERQADATSRVVGSLSTQMRTLSDEVDSATANLVAAQDELVIKRTLLQHRVRDVYKRGPLYALEALLSAQSIGALVSRYKYLHLLAQRDRALLQRVELLNQHIVDSRTQLVRLRTDISLVRAQKEDEERRLRDLAGQRARSLARVQRTARQTEERLRQVQRDEKRLADLLTTFESERRRAAVARPGANAVASTLRTSDVGKLDWPVEGQVLYRYGRVVNPNNTTTRWNGVGIAAAAGTGVKAVAGGTVVLAEPFGTYGQTVIVSHGDGDFSVYGSLARIDVRKGQAIQKGQSLGAVGRADPDMDAHLHFEIRPKGRAVDPMEWLRGRH